MRTQKSLPFWFVPSDPALISLGSLLESVERAEVQELPFNHEPTRVRIVMLIERNAPRESGLVAIVRALVRVVSHWNGHRLSSNTTSEAKSNKGLAS